MTVANTTVQKDKSHDRIMPGVWVGLTCVGALALPPIGIFLALCLAAVYSYSELVGLGGPDFLRQSKPRPSLAWYIEAGLLLCFPLFLTAIDIEVGWKVVALVVFATFVADICALYGGQALGRHKLVERISPGKTVEGVFCGLAGGLLVASVLKPLAGLRLSWPLLLGSTAILVVAGVCGDLNESYLKRGAGVKDSGMLLRGMGGLLDRIDALLAASLVAFILVSLGWL